MKKSYLIMNLVVKSIAKLMMCILLSSLFLNCNESEAADKISIGFFMLPPHVIWDETTRKPSGAAVDFFEEYIKPKLNISVKWVNAPVKRLFHNMKTGKLDAVLLAGKKAAREQFSFYPKFSFIVTRPCLIVMKSHPLTEVKTVEDILKYKIAHHMGSISTLFMRDDRINFDYMAGDDTVRRNLKKLNIGRVDAFYRPTCSSGIYVAGKIGMEKKIRSIYLPEEKMELFTIFSKKSPKGRVMIEKYNKAIGKLITDSSSGNRDIYRLYNNLLKRYIK